MTLSRLEMTVLRIAASKGERPVVINKRSASLKERLLNLLSGSDRTQALADPRLEALRALAAALHRRPRLPVSDFLKAGWTAADLSAVVLAVTGHVEPVQDIITITQD